MIKRIEIPDDKGGDPPGVGILHQRLTELNPALNEGFEVLERKVIPDTFIRSNSGRTIYILYKADPR